MFDRVMNTPLYIFEYLRNSTLQEFNPQREVPSCGQNQVQPAY